MHYKAIHSRTGQPIASRVKIAQDFKSRSIGLLNRTALEADEGLLIKPCNSIHTFFMKFPIDAVFLDKKGKVVKIAHSLGSARLCSAILSGFMVLELPAGRSKLCGINIGDSISFVL